jgi:hypothetical protein
VVSNVIGSGSTCPGDHRGTPGLEAERRPARGSGSLLAQATADGAPATDLYGRKRAHPPRSAPWSDAERAARRARGIV